MLSGELTIVTWILFSSQGQSFSAWCLSVSVLFLVALSPLWVAGQRLGMEFNNTARRSLTAFLWLLITPYDLEFSFS